MKKIAVIMLVLLVSVLFIGIGNAEEVEGSFFNVKIFTCKGCRSTDPCEMWKKWQFSKDPLVRDELKNGNASHNLTPAEFMYYAALENAGNPILLIAILEDQQRLLSWMRAGATKDRERRTFFSHGYAIIDGKTYYRGTYGQAIGTSFQLNEDYKDGLPFLGKGGSYEKNFQTRGEGIRIIYGWLVWEVSRITRKKYESSLDSMDVYKDFRGKEITPRVIQRLLVNIGSPFADQYYFRRKPVDKSFDYENPQCD